eukprot:11957120-Alexandrium_andersonii.AAC.1
MEAGAGIDDPGGAGARKARKPSLRGRSGAAQPPQRYALRVTGDLVMRLALRARSERKTHALGVIARPLGLVH